MGESDGVVGSVTMAGCGVRWSMAMTAAACSAPGWRSQHRVWRTHPEAAAGFCARWVITAGEGAANPSGPVDQRREGGRGWAFAVCGDPVRRFVGCEARRSGVAGRCLRLRVSRWIGWLSSVFAVC